ncbi:hypothetical protein GGTG_07690 [Gaeumannomyces tritici R3-111a-1]|uniref:Uncharacterized protein n=1 Tax=Gaeumannomyces tritici (strain R3-111a-1) TaxID=644352 RepID=J3P2E3_GAET3|nr:hypothetical protein GGTG_07690 [Gaeumannomyces tritici R3-111a-1]EJT73835.1 hypothetical protein GGTG_07690 [Gaeumannomyces tritici R3-111a-1]
MPSRPPKSTSNAYGGGEALKGRLGSLHVSSQHIPAASLSADRGEITVWRLLLYLASATLIENATQDTAFQSTPTFAGAVHPRQSTNPRDICHGLAGIMKALRRHIPHRVFCWALPCHVSDRAILWRPSQGHELDRRPENDGLREEKTCANGTPIGPSSSVTASARPGPQSRACSLLVFPNVVPVLLLAQAVVAGHDLGRFPVERWDATRAATATAFVIHGNGAGRRRRRSRLGPRGKSRAWVAAGFEHVHAIGHVTRGGHGR